MAKRPQKFYFALEKKRLDWFWGSQPFSVLPSRICNTPLPSAFGPMARARVPGLPSCRPFSGPRLFHCGGDESCRKHPMPDPRGTDPTLLGLADFPHQDTLRISCCALAPGNGGASKRPTTNFERNCAVAWACSTARQWMPTRPRSSPTGLKTEWHGAIFPSGAMGNSPTPRCFPSEGRSGLSLGMELRAGNVHASSGASDFLRHILAKLPASVAAPPHPVATRRSALRQGH